MQVDRAEMNRKLFAALKPGGSFASLITRQMQATAPRLGKRSIVLRKVCCAKKLKAAGFKLVAEGDLYGILKTNATSSYFVRRHGRRIRL